MISDGESDNDLRIGGVKVTIAKEIGAVIVT